MYIESYIRKSEQGHIKVLNIMEKEKEVYSYRDGITLRVIVSYPVGFFCFIVAIGGNGILATSNFCKNIHY